MMVGTMAEGATSAHALPARSRCALGRGRNAVGNSVSVSASANVSQDGEYAKAATEAILNLLRNGRRSPFLAAREIKMRSIRPDRALPAESLYPCGRATDLVKVVPIDLGQECYHAHCNEDN